MATGEIRKPIWLRRDMTDGAAARPTQRLLRELSLATVCDSAHCPNRSDCYGRRRATFMILGRTCTRGCGFCAVRHGQGEPLRDDEPIAIAEAAERLGLEHVVITSVTRDDLPDGGAGRFAATITAVRERLATATIEVLTPDFGGSIESLEVVLAARPDVFNHNIETVPRLYPRVRPQASYRRSLVLLAYAADTGTATKSGLMVGLGESSEEVLGVMDDLRRAEVSIVTIGQYLRPSPAQLPVAEYIEPRQFERWRQQGLSMGFAAVHAGPYVRSSYQAEEVFRQAMPSV